MTVVPKKWGGVMPWRPAPPHRRNIRGVIYPLTAAIARIYGIRSDGAYPIGAFYTVNIDRSVWRPVGGIWYLPIEAEKIEGRSISEEAIERFCAAITSERLPRGTGIDWEAIPDDEAAQLPVI
jgi:hypothetical protein